MHFKGLGCAVVRRDELQLDHVFWWNCDSHMQSWGLIRQLHKNITFHVSMLSPLRFASV